MAVPALKYNCENWTLKRADRRKIEAAEIKFLRNKKHNTDIRAQLNISHLGNKTEHRKRDWYEHSLRMKDSHFYNICTHR
jgi:hypothetical protein